MAMKAKTYKGRYTKEISFPLGGLGTGSIGLAGNGMLADWEIQNRPAKHSINGYSNIAIKAEDAKGLVAARGLNGDYLKAYTGEMGPSRNCMAGLPHFADHEFRGGYPIAEMRFRDAGFPGEVELTAFNPFIPGDDRSSSIPAAFLEYAVRNTTRRALDYTICFSIRNPMAGGPGANTFEKADRFHSMRYTTAKCEPDKPEWGEMTVATDCSDVSFQENWMRAKGFEPVTIFWRDFTSAPRLANRTYAPDPERGGMASLAARFRVPAGGKGRVRFVIAWFFPNASNYWNPMKCEPKEGEEAKEGSCCAVGDPNVWRNYYASMFTGSPDVASYALDFWDELYRGTKAFRDALFSSTLPPYVLDAVSANLSTLKSTTCLRLADGSLYGFEGCFGAAGCCEGSCTHVWNYAYALPYLFPKLERSMRELDYTYNQNEAGEMNFRLQLPLGRVPASRFRACADGVFGGVVKLYRDWKISGDDEFLKRLWPAARRSLEYAWSPENPDRWDPEKTGVLWGRQHHTLDEELFGPSSWLEGFYVAALLAASDIAAALGEREESEGYAELARKGYEWMDANLFNGEYFNQKIDLTDKALLERFGAVEQYWIGEKGEIRYQIADGCAADQMLAQWHANLCGLGPIYDAKKMAKALGAIYRHNFKKDLRGYFNPCRLYGFNDEAGTVICDWPDGHYMPQMPLQYAQETMNGFEYSAAALLIQEGLVDEGLEMVKAVRDRYDGAKRDPWDEFECGHHYARSMASYSLLSALSGFECDLRDGIRMIGFDPKLECGDGSFRTFWSLEGAWGVFDSDGDGATLTVLAGRLELSTLRLPFAAKRKLAGATLGGEAIRTKKTGAEFRFAAPASVEPGKKLSISLA